MSETGHMTLKAVSTVTDQGVFEAVISTVSADRERDIVEPAALVKALKKWNRPIPLQWEHSTDPEDIIGTVEPMTARVVGAEVVVGGTVDLESRKGAEAWRSFKAGSIGFSYGYMLLDGGFTDRKGGGKRITALDLFEVTATRTPMNNDTRVLGWKAVPADELPAAILEALGSLQISDEAKVDLLLKAQEALGVQPPQQADVTGKEPEPARSVDPLKPPDQQVPDHVAQKREARRLMLSILSE